MIRSFLSILCVLSLVGCASADFSSQRTQNAVQKPTQTRVTPSDGRLTVRHDFAENIPKLMYFLHSEKPDRNGTKQYLMDTPEVRNLLQIHPDAIVDRDKRETKGNISLTNRAEYRTPAFAKQCVGFIKAIVTDRNWTTRDIRGSKTPLSPSNLPNKYDVIGYFAGGVDENGYGVYKHSGSHMAIYLGTYENGIIVLDQNHNGEGSIAVRKIAWESLRKQPSMLGGKYYRVVLK